MSLPEINTLDVDGALRDAEVDVAGDTRAAFFRKAAVGGGAVITSGAFMGMLPELALGARKSKKNDVAIANYALTLEYLEAAFYEQALKNVSFTVPGARDLTQLIAAHERTHVKTLKGVLKSAAVKEPKFDFGDAVTNEAKFIQTALVLENTGVSAYLGQVANIKQTPILVAAGTIVTIEARHAAAVAALLGTTADGDGFGNAFNDKGALSITPDGAFDVPKSKKKILKAVGATGFIKG